MHVLNLDKIPTKGSSMKKIVCSMFLTGACLLAGCTENERVRNFGGTKQVELPAGEKLVNITWKENNVWYLTRTRHPDEKPEIYKFSEDSNFGVAKGSIVIREK